MADTTYGVNHPVAVQYWHRRLFQEAIRQSWAGKFIGESGDANALIYRLDETSKGPGDTVYPILQAQLQGVGIQGDGTLEGNEEEIQVARDSLVLNQIRHAVRSGGRMSEQRVPFSVRESAYARLVDWWARRLDVSLMNQLAGNTGQSNTIYTGNNATVAPSTNNHLFVGGTAEESLSASASSAFSLSVIDRMVVRAKTKANTPVRPIMIGGEEKYVVFIHPFQHHQLRTTAAASGNYLDIQKAAISGGQITGNPLYTGAVGEWNGCIIHESYRVPGGKATAGDAGAVATGLTQASVYRAMLCGAQAATIAFGGNTSNAQPNWYEELFDYGNKLGVSAGMILGIKKSRFTVNATAEDFGVIVASTFSADPS